MTVPERLAKLREEMKKENIDCYIVPTADFHQSEYVGEYFKARKFITGFTGSAGTAVITMQDAVLFTDGRYFIQAEEQLKDSTVALMKMGEPNVPSLAEYVESKLGEKQTLGFDGRVVTMSDGCAYEEIVAKKNGKIKYDQDLIDRIWTDRPSLSGEPAFDLDIQYTGESTEDKLKRIRNVMREQGAEYHVLTTLDDICWTMNIRGNDIEFFPMVLSYAIIGMENVKLYIDDAKLCDGIKDRLKRAGITFLSYNAIYNDIKQMGQATLLIDPSRINYALFSNIPSSATLIRDRNPEVLFKAVKNPVEIENIRKAQIKDSVAHIKFMKWLKENVGKMKITEISASEKLDKLREEQGGFIRPSFEPISSVGEHAAMCHYTSTPQTDVELQEGTVFLTDTGAGFIEGSTDITRTYAIGELPQVMKEHFSLVLKSNLQLANARFLKGCTGMNLDILARKPFWDREVNFNHGTGHGVGYLLNIHEGPANFRWQYRAGDTQPFEEGMVITDEPGIYIEGSYGIRLENELLVRNGGQNEYGQFLYFEIITYVPMDLDAIDPDILSEEDKRLLNAYHKTVYEKTAPYLTEDEKEWLKTYTRAI